MNDATQRFQPTADKAEDLRRALGRFGTGVTIVTAQTSHGPLGMTANSFTSVSLDPALVLWSPAKSSQRHDSFATAARFCVHVLAADQQDLARHFSRDGLSFDGIAHSVSPSDLPILDGCLAHFECDTYAVHPAGDHSLILGHVRAVEIAPGEAPGLMFDQGRFGRFTPQ